MLGEGRVVTLDPAQGVAYAGGHRLAGTLVGCAEATASSAEPDRARQLSEKRLSFESCLVGSMRIMVGGRVVDLRFEVGEARPVGSLGRLVEHRVATGQRPGRIAGVEPRG